MSARIKNGSPLVTKNPSFTGEDTKCVSTCVDQTPRMPTRTQHVPQHVSTIPIACQWTVKNISKCVDQTHPIPARTQNESQHVLTKPLHKMHLKIVDLGQQITQSKTDKPQIIAGDFNCRLNIPNHKTKLVLESLEEECFFPAKR